MWEGLQKSRGAGGIQRNRAFWIVMRTMGEGRYTAQTPGFHSRFTKG